MEFGGEGEIVRQSTTESLDPQALTLSRRHLGYIGYLDSDQEWHDLLTFTSSCFDTSVLQPQVAVLYNRDLHVSSHMRSV